MLIADHRNSNRKCFFFRRIGWVVPVRKLAGRYILNILQYNMHKYHLKYFFYIIPILSSFLLTAYVLIFFIKFSFSLLLKYFFRSFFELYLFLFPSFFFHPYDIHFSRECLLSSRESVSVLILILLLGLWLWW